MSQRIDYKLAVLVYRCLNGLAPSYLANDLHSSVWRTSTPGGVLSLDHSARSDSTQLNATQLVELSRIGRYDHYYDQTQTQLNSVVTQFPFEQSVLGRTSTIFHP